MLTTFIVLCLIAMVLWRYLLKIVLAAALVLLVVGVVQVANMAASVVGPPAHEIACSTTGGTLC
ncbi:hypothetical protein [Amycolatopsis sp. CA-230715]|uniref:hypothetical protein n=1 Tax=Amycolatopsis sp. CA-230715 TaxID=2745196 RepID=UPI001C02E9DF|nr:hypothetical protein [Amycolatopsis sp. CA-230715]QWF82398.1 hypothetical protein HUW46_05835 [Amycolatopsis sp. CA-230715]